MKYKETKVILLEPRDKEVAQQKFHCFFIHLPTSLSQRRCILYLKFFSILFSSQFLQGIFVALSREYILYNLLLFNYFTFFFFFTFLLNYLFILFLLFLYMFYYKLSSTSGLKKSLKNPFQL